MIIRSIVNFALKRTFRGLWDTLPTVEHMRSTYTRADRVAAFGRKRVPVSVDVVGGVGVEWVGPRENARQGTVLYLHGGAFAMRGVLTDRRFSARLARRTGISTVQRQTIPTRHRFSVTGQD